MDILFATTNQGKIREAKSYATKFNINIVSIADLNAEIPAPDEDTQSYQGNAELKAKYYFEKTKLPCLADDSGLEVKSLGGRPGVDTAIYGGEHLTYQQRMELVLEELKDFSDRSARYVCHLSFFDGNVFKNTNAYLKGMIADAINGSGGFGYDPIFIPENYSSTAGELKQLGIEIKTHRTKALDNFFDLIK